MNKFDIYCYFYTFIEQADTSSGISTIEEPFNLIDEFDSSNLESHWSHEIYIPQEPVCKNNIKLLY